MNAKFIPCAAVFNRAMFTPSCIGEVSILWGNDVLILSKEKGADLDNTDIKYRIRQKGDRLTTAFENVIVRDGNIQVHQ